MKKSIDFLIEYLKENNIYLDINKYISAVEHSNNDYKTYEHKQIFDCIIVDAYNGFSKGVKEISNYLIKNHNIYLGRKDKLIIKSILDYNKIEYLLKIKKIENIIPDIKRLIISIRHKSIIEDCRDEYFTKLSQAIDHKDTKRIQDYINFLYSRVLLFNEYKNISLRDVFLNNKQMLKKEYDFTSFKLFEDICLNDTVQNSYNDTIKLYTKTFQNIFLTNKDKLNDIIVVNVNQELFDIFQNKNNFYSYLFNLINETYRQINNHRTLVIKVENIISDSINLKWEIYSYMTIYGETFKTYNDYSTFYKPEQIALDYFEHKFNIRKDKDNLNIFKKYFDNEISLNRLSNQLNISISENEINFFKNINYGFEFVDCFILKRDKDYPNSEELDFIENKNELLLIFQKHDFDSRKIPCPVCGSLKISGNSYSSIGLKSWECKNQLCSGRSKTNRGKRYSSRSIDMQNSIENDIEDNLISKELISKWRKDVVYEDSYNSMFEMIIKYFSFSESSVLFLNFEENELHLKSNFNRIISKKNINEFLSFNLIQGLSLDDFLNSTLVNKFIYDNTVYNNEIKEDISSVNSYLIKKENCINFLCGLDDNVIDNMITSPPYYNAREYSTWKNLYNYLNDMYKITKISYDKLKSGGVFFYNIGDIFDNPNTIVKSTMGNKRVPLGAYMILVFQKAGFELLDNIIWDKGETQSNRHKNDGNYTPYYQRPANCYEHIFIFKKPGKLKLSKEPLLKNNIQRFSPVIKINNKGENLLGHTAPYPIELPLLSINTFTSIDDIIFDPFLGSGTTVYTAVNQNRKGIGTELNEEYFKLADKYVDLKINKKQLNIFTF